MRRFIQKRDGNIAILFGLSFIPLIFLAGVGIDYGRASALRTRLQNAVDGTTLTLCQTSSATTNAALEDQAAKLLEAYMSGKATLVTPLAVGANPRTITVKAHATYRTAFASLMHIDTVEVGASSQCATPMAQTFEIALALDTTGSMRDTGGSGTKMGAVQEAAKKFVDYVATRPAFSPQTRISVVPFANAVAVDPNTYGASTTWIDGNAQSAYHWVNVDFSAANATVKAAIKSRFDIFAQLKPLDATWGWAGCLETLPYPLNVQDLAPTPGNPDSYLVPMFAPDEPGGNTTQRAYISGDSKSNYPTTTDTYTNLNSWGQIYYNSYLEDHALKSDCDVKSMTAVEAEMRACKYYRPAHFSSGMSRRNVPNGPNYGCTSKPLQTLTNDTTKLKALIDSLVPQGSTSIFDGFVWAWRTISPLNVFAQGAAYNDTTVHKVIVLMTDGINSWDANADLHIDNINESLFSGMGYVTNGNGTKVAGTPALAGRLVAGTPSPTSSAKIRAALDALTSEACVNAKARNISVYTIGFSVPQRPHRSGRHRPPAELRDEAEPSVHRQLVCRPHHRLR